MKIKHYEIDIPEGNPFTNCKLAREPYAKVLTAIVNTYADGFVLAINNEWGTGKTTFIKMWQKHLENEKFQTIYFNAWENDFDNNPLVAIISELESLTNKGNKKTFKSVIEKGAILVKNVAPAVIKAIAKKYIDTEAITEAIENTAKAGVEILEEEIKLYNSKKITIKEFKEVLEEFIQQRENKKPLIFIIDELDRCRPTYAVELLEQMKHFFSVSGIVFVLSIDKTHLSSSIKGFYGSENINTDEYLRRFLDLEYSLPRPTDDRFTNYLFEYFNFDEFFFSDIRQRNSVFKKDGSFLLQMAQTIFRKANPTLRQQEKIFGHTRLVLNTFHQNQIVFSFLLLLLVFLKIMRQKLYQAIEEKKISLQELSDSYYDLMPVDIKSEYALNYVFIEASLLHFYNNDFEYQDRVKLLKPIAGEKNECPINSKLEKVIEKTSLISALELVDREWDYRDVKLSTLIQKINLNENFVILTV